MYSKIICAFSLIFVTTVNGHLDGRNSSLLRQNTNKCDLTAHPQCSSDCSTILLCYAGIDNPIFSIKCPSNTPYCDNGRCADAPGSCSFKSNNSSLVCTSSGLFPDPSDCSKYHNCADGGGTSLPEKCPTGYIFNSKFKMCVREGDRADRNDRKICQKINCDGVTNDFILFTANPAYYAYCFISPAGERQTYMYKCDDDASKVFDLKTKTCRFNCKSVGYFADPLDCSAYYICNRRGSNFVPRHIHCPPNYYFNGTACLNSAAHCPPGSMTTITSTTTVQSTPTSNATTESSLTTDSVTTQSSLTTDAVTTQSSLTTDAVIAESSLTTDAATAQSSLTTDAVTAQSSLTTDAVTTQSSLTTDAATAQSSLTTNAATAQSSLTTDAVTAQSSLLTTDAVTAQSSLMTTDAVTAQSSLLTTGAVTTQSSLTTDATTTDVTQMMSEYTSEINTERVSESTETTQMNMNDPTSIPTDVVTSVPFKSTIWKHMGRFSVRIGKFLNFI